MPVDGDAREEFHALFTVMLPQIRTWLRRQGLGDDVDDVAAEVFVVVWSRWDDLPTDPGERRAWVFGVARHKMQHARGARAEALDPSRLRHLHVDAPVPDPAHQVGEKDWLSRAMAALPPAERDAVAMTLLADLTLSQAAGALGCSVSALTSRLSRARSRMARLAADEAAARDGERGAP